MTVARTKIQLPLKAKMNVNIPHFKEKTHLDIAGHTYHSSPWEAEAGDHHGLKSRSA